MVATFLQLLIIAHVALAVRLLFSYLKSSKEQRKFKQFADENGCAAPYLVPNRWPLGLERLWNILRLPWTGKDLFDDFIMPGQTEAGFTAEVKEISGKIQVITSDPENLKAMLATKFNDFEIGLDRRTAFGPILGKGIFNSDGQQWAHARAMFRPQFNRDNINDLDETERSTQLLLKTFPVQADGWTEVFDIQPLFFNFTLDTSTSFLFGESLDTLRIKIPGNGDIAAVAPEIRAQKATNTNMKLGDAIDIAQWWLILRIRLGSTHLTSVADSPGFRKTCKYIHEVVGYFADAAKGVGRSDVEKEIGARKYNLLQALMEQTQDSVELRDQVLSIMFAGRDTTAALLSWTFYELSRNPDVFNKLRQAILDDFGTRPEKANFATLKSCKYLQYCMNEVLRLWPSVPANSREASCDTVLPRGGGPNKDQPIAVRKGTTVAFTVYVTHRREDLWGSDAAEFRPERWEGKKLDWSYIPFLGGPRVCLGQQYALTEAGYLIVRLLQRFDKLEYLGPPGKAKKGFGITLFPGDGVKIRMRAAKA